MKDMLLILDLDETLVYANETPLEYPAHFMIDARYHVYCRPNLGAFLEYCLSEFMVAVWTCASPSYAALLVPMIFPDASQLAFVWGRDRCTMHHDMEVKSRHLVKPLNKVKRRGYTLERTLMIDDSPEKMVRSYGNHIRVEPFMGDPADKELLLLARYLDSLKGLSNVRQVEKRYWRKGLDVS